MKWRHYGLTVVAAALGVAAAGVTWHVYQDHLTVHAVVDYLNRAAAQAQQKAAVAAPSQPAEPSK